MKLPKNNNNNNNFLDIILPEHYKREFLKKTKDYLENGIESFKNKDASYQDVKAFITSSYHGDLLRFLGKLSDIKSIINRDRKTLEKSEKQYEISKKLIKNYIKSIFPQKKGLLKKVTNLVKTNPKYEKLETEITIDTAAEHLLILLLTNIIIVWGREDNINIYFGKRA